METLIVAVSRSVGWIWGEAVGLILWNLDRQAFHKFLHIIRYFNSEQTLSSAVDREWSSACFQCDFGDTKKKSPEALLGHQHQLAASPPVQTGKKQTGFLLLLTGHL